MIAISDLFRVSVRQVIRQKSVGVVFSIALGITAFISLSVLGREIRYNIGQDMVLMGGVNVMRVYMDDTQYPGQPRREFFDDTITALRALPGVATVSLNPANGQNFPLRVGERTLNTMFIAIDQYFGDTYASILYAGREIDADDIKNRSRVCVLGRDLSRDLFGSEKDAVGQLLFLNNDVFEVVGVIGGVMMGSWSKGGFMPYTTAIDRNWAGGKVTRLFIRAVGWEDVAKLIKTIPTVIREHQDAPYLVIQTQEEQLERIQTTFVWVEALLWLGIVASLMLGGFGIWSGTFASVRARTREVGLKKAMGGSDGDILAQFLAEALCKSVAGGFVGILIGTTMVEIGSFFLNCQVSYAQLLLSSAGSIVFSAVIGVAGGIYPAMQASRMDVVTALRFE